MNLFILTSSAVSAASDLFGENDSGFLYGGERPPMDIEGFVILRLPMLWVLASLREDLKLDLPALCPVTSYYC